MTNISELDLVNAVRKHALNNYENDGWDYLVECWDDGDILEQISDKNATAPQLPLLHVWPS